MTGQATSAWVSAAPRRRLSAARPSFRLENWRTPEGWCLNVFWLTVGGLTRICRGDSCSCASQSPGALASDAPFRTLCIVSVHIVFDVATQTSGERAAEL